MLTSVFSLFICRKSTKKKMAETQTLNFGPEWLRALSSGGGGGGGSGCAVASPPLSPVLPKYKLADYRYGREEMLALYVKDNKVCEAAAFPITTLRRFYLPHEKHQSLVTQPQDPRCLLRSPQTCRTRSSCPYCKRSRCRLWRSCLSQRRNRWDALVLGGRPGPGGTPWSWGGLRLRWD
uniref:Uncharacterized protein n=1 Tax=Takifugu rubripes TaxID=31033 RepID=A0A674NZ40_TAKRU